MTKSKKKIIFFSTSFILTICLMGFMGVYALTILKNSQINVGISYQPEYLVKVEMGIDGANSRTGNQTIEESEYVEIYNSLNPVSNGMYIQSMSNDTIHINSQTLTPIGVNGDVYFRITSLENETSGNKDLQCIIDCGSSTADSGKLIVNTPKELTISTGLNAINGTITEDALETIKINIKIQEYQPKLTALNFQFTDLSILPETSIDEVINKINLLNVVGKYEDDSEKILILNTDYNIDFQRTDGGGNGNFTQLGIAGTITAIAISNNDLQSTIYLKVENYAIRTYISNNAPVYNDNDKSNYYMHYIELGEYPQRFAGTINEISASLQGSYYIDDSNISKKYILKGDNYYLVEPVRWIVIGITDGVYSGGQHVLFTSGNKAENTSSNSGLWLYDETTNSFKYRTTTSDAWQKATEVLLLSEYGLLKSKFSGTNETHFSKSDIRKILDTNEDSLYNTMFTDAQKNKIKSTTLPITSYFGGGIDSTNFNDVNYKLFLLGSNLTALSGTFKNCSDSYNIATYFIPPASESISRNNIKTKETAFSCGGLQNNTDNYLDCFWWSRTGRVYGNTLSTMAFSTNCIITIRNSTDNLSLRPACVFNL